MGHFLGHPNATYKFGQPFDSRHPEDDKTINGYFEWLNDSGDEQPIGATINFTTEEVSSISELYKYFSIDLAVEAKFTFSNAKATFSWEKEFEFSDTSLVYIVQGRKVYNTQSKNGVLDFSEKGRNAWAKAIEREDFGKFQSICGTDIITQVRRGKILSLVYVFYCSNSNYKEKIKTSLEAAWVSGSVNLNFKEELNSIDKNLSIKIFGTESGVAANSISNSRLSDVLAVDPGNIVGIKKIVSEILGDVSNEDRDAAEILDFRTKPISEFDAIVWSDFHDDYLLIIQLNMIIDKQLIRLRELYLKNQKNLNTAQEILDNNYFQNGKKEDLISKIDELTFFENDLFEKYEQIIAAKKREDLDLNFRQLPDFNYSDFRIMPNIIPVSWDDNLTAWEDGGRGGFLSRFSIRVIFKFEENIKRISLYKNGVVILNLDQNQVKDIASSGGNFFKYWYLEHYTMDVKCLAAPLYRCRKEDIEILKYQYNGLHKSKESANEYYLEFEDDRSNTKSISIGNPSKPMPINLQDIGIDQVSFLKSIDRDFLSNFEFSETI